MKTVKEIKSDIDNDFQKGAVKCVENIVNEIEKARERGKTDIKDTLTFTPDNLENLDVFFKEIVLALIYKGYRLKPRDIRISGNLIVEVYLNRGHKDSKTYFENVQNENGIDEYAHIKTFKQLTEQKYVNDDEFIKRTLDNIEQDIRQRIVVNKNSVREIKQISIRYPIPNEGAISIAHYCKNDEKLKRIVMELNASGYTCETDIGNRLIGRIRNKDFIMENGYYYRDLVISWED